MIDVIHYVEKGFSDWAAVCGVHLERVLKSMDMDYVTCPDCIRELKDAGYQIPSNAMKRLRGEPVFGSVPTFCEELNCEQPIKYYVEIPQGIKFVCEDHCKKLTEEKCP